MIDKSIFDGCIAWWHTIRPKDGFDRYNGDRAELRRAHSTTEVIFLPIYHLLLEKTNTDYQNQEQLHSLAAVAWVLSWVNQESETKFAESLGKCEKPKFNDIRFRRLIESTDIEELAIQLIRALKFTKRTANIPDLIRSILDWNHGSYVKEQWALAYYRVVKKD